MKQKDMSLTTKKALAEALKKLMAGKSINKITVHELVSACGLNRNSFYYHFADIYDLFKWMIEEEAIEVVRQYDLMLDCHEVIHFVLDYVENNQYLLANAYNAVGQAGLKRFLFLDFNACLDSLIEQSAGKSGIVLEADYRQFLCTFFTEALAGTLLDYITHPQKRSREKTVAYAERLLKSAIPAAIQQRPSRGD